MQVRMTGQLQIAEGQEEQPHGSQWNLNHVVRILYIHTYIHIQADFTYINVEHIIAFNKVTIVVVDINIRRI